MPEQNYSPPVDKLLTYGEDLAGSEWMDYLELGLTSEHIPELIRLATDDELRWADEDTPEVWAPVHAWRALGQLRAKEAVEPLMNLFHELDDDDWASDDLPEVYGMIGPEAVPALTGYLSKASHEMYPRVAAARSLERIGNAYPEAREQCVSALTHQLDRFSQNDPSFNALLISYLVDLHAVESIPSIRRAFRHNSVDYLVQGDVEEVEIELGIRENRSTPPDYPSVKDVFFSDPEPVQVQTRRTAPKIGRNDPCPCGSGRKYKKCCLNT